MKQIALALALITLILFSVLAASNLVWAVNEVYTAAFISVPATAEVAQEISVEMWIEPAPPNSADLYRSFNLIITSPDGVAKQYIPLLRESTKFWWVYKPNQLGNFTFQFSYSGETFSDGRVFKPSKSRLVTLTVVGDPVPPVEIPGGSWAERHSMNQARGGLGVAAVNGKIYAIGGRVENDSYYMQNPTTGFVGTNEEYDPATDKWILKASMPTPRSATRSSPSPTPRSA